MDESDVRARLCRVMRYEGDDWLERAEQLLDAHWCKQQGRKVYDVSTVGYRLRTARECMGMSQSQLALRLGVAVNVVSKWELGQRNLPIAQARKLAIVLRPVCTAEWLYMASDAGGPNVPVHVLSKHHSPRWYEYRKRREAFNKAQQEVRAREAARAARKTPCT